MSIAVSLLLSLSSVSADTLTTGYVHQIRAEMALADRVFLRPSRTNGGGAFGITEAKDLQALARAIDRKWEAIEFSAKAGSADYVIVDVYFASTSKQPDLTITVLRTVSLFKVNGTQYLLRTPGGGLYKAIFKMVAKKDGR